MLYAKLKVYNCCLKKTTTTTMKESKQSDVLAVAFPICS